jgi:hypothetical protein
MFANERENVTNETIEFTCLVFTCSSNQLSTNGHVLYVLIVRSTSIKMMMSKHSRRSIRPIDLTLDKARTHVDEIHSTINNQHVPSKVNYRYSTARIRSLSHLKHLTGPIYVNVFVDIPSTKIERQSKPLNHAENVRQNQLHRQQQSINVDHDRCQLPSIDPLLCDTLSSFGVPHSSIRSSDQWKHVYRPQLTSIKVLHARTTTPAHSLNDHKRSATSSDGAIPDSSFQPLLTSMHQCFDDHVEQITRTYFPSIQQLRHSKANSNTSNIHRMYLHREQKSSTVPVVMSTRVMS